MKFQSTLGNTTYITTSSEFAKLGLIYWTLRYRNCPASHQYFQLSKELCHDVCPIGTYTIESSKLCKDCFYTCQQCSSYPSCSGCSSSSNRYLNGTRCLPIAGFYENGTAFAPPCSTGCIDCTSGSNCFACGTGFVLNTSTNSCDKLCE